MFFKNRRVAYTLLWLLNHIPFYRNRFEVEVIEFETDYFEGEAQWTPEQELALQDILDDKGRL
jgi:hypothetical protein